MLFLYDFTENTEETCGQGSLVMNHVLVLQKLLVAKQVYSLPYQLL